MSDTMDLNELQRRLGDLGTETRDDLEGPYLSIPVCHATAIEVEMQAGKAWVVWREWDRTHGLAREDFLAEEINLSQVERVVREAVRTYEDNANYYESLMPEE